MDVLEIKKMSRIERLQAIEALWDSLLNEEAEVESPEWHLGSSQGKKKKDRKWPGRIHFLREIEGQP